MGVLALSIFDPRQPHQRTLGTAAVETHPFPDILVPPLDKITHMITQIRCQQKMKKK